MLRLPPFLVLLACAPLEAPVFGSEGATLGEPADACTVRAPPSGFSSQGAAADAHASVYGEQPEPFHVHLGMPRRDASRSLSVLWRTDVDTRASLLQIGPVDGFPATATVHAGASFLFGAGEPNSGPYRQHEVRVCGDLSPDTVYRYRVGGPGGWSEPVDIRTAPAADSAAPLRVALLGDSRGDPETWGALLELIDAEEPDVILHTGDMVDFGGTQEEWDAWFGAASSVLARRHLYVAHGNHEYLAQNYFAQLGLPGNEQWYAVDHGPLHLLSLNDTVAQASDLTAQTTFLDAELAASAAPWRMAIHHQATWSTCTSHGSNETVREAFGPAWERGGVQLVAAGHNHIYERSHPLREGAVVGEGEGTVYLVSGGAGAPLYTEYVPEPWSAVQNPIEHFVLIDLGPESAEAVVRDLAGNTIDSFTVPR